MKKTLTPTALGTAFNLILQKAPQPKGLISPDAKVLLLTYITFRLQEHFEPVAYAADEWDGKFFGIFPKLKDGMLHTAEEYRKSILILALEYHLIYFNC